MGNCFAHNCFLFRVSVYECSLMSFSASLFDIFSHRLSGMSQDAAISRTGLVHGK